jgi:hypothetical protein
MGPGLQQVYAAGGAGEIVLILATEGTECTQKMSVYILCLLWQFYSFPKEQNHAPLSPLSFIFAPNQLIKWRQR